MRGVRGGEGRGGEGGIAELRKVIEKGRICQRHWRKLLQIAVSAVFNVLASLKAIFLRIEVKQNVRFDFQLDNDEEKISSC